MAKKDDTERTDMVKKDNTPVWIGLGVFVIVAIAIFATMWW